MHPGDLSKVQPVTNDPRVGNAYLMRGIVGVFSTGMDRLGDELNSAGVNAQVFQDDQWTALAEQLKQRYANRKNVEPLVLIGHSWGADHMLEIARELDQAHIAVDLIITLDPVTPPPLPRNVRLCENLYQSNGIFDNFPWFRGVPIKPEPGEAARLFNFDLRTDRTDLYEPGLDHFNIEKKQKVHEEILLRVLAACPTRDTWAAGQHPVQPDPEQHADASSRNPLD